METLLDCVMGLGTCLINRIWQSSGLSLLGLGYKRTVTSTVNVLLLSWVTCSGGSQLPCHEDTDQLMERLTQ